MARENELVLPRELPKRFMWLDDEKEFDVIRYDDESRRKTVEALLAESRDMLKNS